MIKKINLFKSEFGLSLSYFVLLEDNWEYSNLLPDNQSLQNIQCSKILKLNTIELYPITQYKDGKHIYVHLDILKTLLVLSNTKNKKFEIIFQKKKIKTMSWVLRNQKCF